MNVLCGQWKKIARLLDIPTLVFEWQLWINGTFAHAAVEESTSDWIFSIHSSERRLWVAGHSKLSSKIVTDISPVIILLFIWKYILPFFIFYFHYFSVCGKGGYSFLFMSNSYPWKSTILGWCFMFRGVFPFCCHSVEQYQKYLAI